MRALIRRLLPVGRVAQSLIVSTDSEIVIARFTRLFIAT